MEFGEKKKGKIFPFTTFRFFSWQIIILRCKYAVEFEPQFD